MLLVATLTTPAQLSSAVAPGSINGEWHSLVSGVPPSSVTTGAAVSATTTVLVLLVALPDTSKAVSTTRLVPSDRTVLAGGFCVTVTELLQPSTAMM